MIVVIGLIILIAAVVVGMAGVLSNSGSGHALGSGWSVFGYHVTGSTGTLFLYGIAVGIIAMVGLSLLLAAARRTSRRGRDARRGLRQSRRETAAVSQDRDDLIDQHARALATAGTAPSDPADGDRPPGLASRLARTMHLPASRAMSLRHTEADSAPVADQTDVRVPADATTTAP